MKSRKQKQNKRGIVKDTRGLSTVEYIIILILIAVAGIGLWTTFGETLESKITGATNAVETMGGE